MEGVCRWKAEVEWQLKIGVEEERALSLSLSARQDASKHLFFVSETVPLSDSGQIELAQAGGERPFLVRSRPAGKSLNFFCPSRELL